MATDLNGVHGPIDFLLLQVPPGADTTAMGEAMFEAVNRGIVRLYDLLIIRKEADGTFSGINASDLSDHGLGGFTAFAGAQSGLLSDDDLAEAAEVMDPGSLAALFVYENSWAIPFIGAALDAKAEVIATDRIPAAVVMEVLDLLEAADAAS